MLVNDTGLQSSGSSLSPFKKKALYQLLRFLGIFPVSKEHSIISWIGSAISCLQYSKMCPHTPPGPIVIFLSNSFIIFCISSLLILISHFSLFLFCLWFYKFRFCCKHLLKIFVQYFIDFLQVLIYFLIFLQPSHTFLFYFSINESIKLYWVFFTLVNYILFLSLFTFSPPLSYVSHLTSLQLKFPINIILFLLIIIFSKFSKASSINPSCSSLVQCFVLGF